MKRSIILLIACLIGFGSLYAEKYAGEIFRLGAGVRNQALGGCGVADINTAQPAYWNPSFLIYRTGTDMTLSHSEDFDGLFTYDQASFNLDHRIALSLLRIGIDDVPKTRLTNPGDSISNDNRPYKYGSDTNADYILYLGIARQVGGLPLGISPKLAYRSLSGHDGFGFGADISTHYRPTSYWLLGARLRDVFTTQILWESGTHETVNPGLDLESCLSFRMPFTHFPTEFLCGAGIDSEGREDMATVSAGNFSADFHTGLSISVHPKAQLYVGYDVDNFTAGCGLHLGPAMVNYAFEHDSDLNNSHRVELGWNFR